jgi:hypothetical protein
MTPIIAPRPAIPTRSPTSSGISHLRKPSSADPHAAMTPIIHASHLFQAQAICDRALLSLGLPGCTRSVISFQVVCPRMPLESFRSSRVKHCILSVSLTMGYGKRETRLGWKEASRVFHSPFNPLTR